MSLTRKLRRQINRNKRVPSRRVLFEQLEPRFLLSADLPAPLAPGLDPQSFLTDRGMVKPAEAPPPPLCISEAPNSAPVTATNEQPLQSSLDPPEDEPNDTRIDALLIPLTEEPIGSGLFKGVGSGLQDPATGSLWSDPDYWRIEALAGDVVSLSVATPGSSVDTYVELHNAADSNLVSDNNSGPDNDAFISHYTIPSSGSYYVKVGNYYSSTPGSYERIFPRRA